MDTTTIRVREPRELLALLPFQLGFRPEDSAVTVSLRPPRGRVGLIARVDLPDLAEPDLGPGLARRLVTHLVNDGAAQAVLVLYTSRDPRPWPTPPGDTSTEGAEHQAARHLRAAAAAFLGEVAVWVVGPAGYLSLDCADARCCPRGGRPLHDLQSTEVSAHMVLAGAMVADSRDTLVPVLRAPAGDRRSAVRAAGRSLARRVAATAEGDRALAAWRSGALDTWRAALGQLRCGGAAPPPAQLGRIVAALEDVTVRDAVLLTLVADAGDLPERSVERMAGTDLVAEQVAAALAAIVSPTGGVPPEPATLVAASELLERVVGHADGARQAPALTLLGLLAWWHGDGARAAVLVDRALTADPAHRLAHLLADALGAGLAPGWVRRPG